MKPMTQEDALRIIRNVSDRIAHETPILDQVVAAVGKGKWDVDERMRLVQQMLEVFSVVGTMGEMIKKQVYHGHPPERLAALKAIEQAYEQIGLLEVLWMVAIPPAPKTLLDQEVE